MKRIITQTSLRYCLLLLTWIGISAVSYAQLSTAYITKDLTGGGKYCLELKSTGSNDWYLSGIWVQGMTDDATAAPLTYEIVGGTNINLQASSAKFGSDNAVTITNLTQIGNPSSTTLISHSSETTFETNKPKWGATVLVKNDANNTVLARPYILNLKGGIKTINPGAFYIDNYLTKVILSDDGGNYIALEQVKNAAFAYCSKLTTFTHTQFQSSCYFPSKIKLIDDFAFGYCALTGKLSVPTSCEKVGYAGFTKNSNLAEVEWRNDNNVSTPTATIGNFAFFNCGNIKKAVFGKNTKTIGHQSFVSSPITYISFADGLETIEALAFNSINYKGDMLLPTSLKVIGNQAFGYFPDDSHGWIFYNELQLHEGLEQIGSFVFSGMRSVQENLIIPNSVKIIGTNAFVNAPIRHLTIGTGVESMDVNVFRNCALLETADFLPNTKLSQFYQTFADCPNLRYVRMDKVENAALNSWLSTKTFTRKKTVAENAFGSMSPYTLVYLPKGFNDKAAITADANNVNDVNFIFCADGSYTCPKFVAFDKHANYQAKLYTMVSSYPNVEASILANPNQTKVAEYKKIAEMPELSARGCDYEIPVTFTAAKASYVRTFTTAQYYTVSLPYKPAWTQATMNSVKPFKMSHNLYTQGSQTGHYFYSIDDKYFRQQHLDKLTASEKDYKMSPYQGYAVHFYGSEDFTKLFDAENVKVYAPNDAEVTAEAGLSNNVSNDWKLVGTMRNKYNAEAAAGNPLYILNGVTKTWHKVSTSPSFLASFRAGVQAVTANPAKAFVAFFMDEQGSATAIDRLEQDMLQGLEPIYTTDGRYVGNDLNALPAGIYVVKGKKFMKN